MPKQPLNDDGYDPYDRTPVAVIGCLAFVTAAYFGVHIVLAAWRYAS